MERLGLTGGRSDDWRVRDKLEQILEVATLMRAWALDDTSVFPDRRDRFQKESFEAASALIPNALSEEPQWGGICQCEAGQRLLEEWLRQAIFRGGQTRGALEFLRKRFAHLRSDGLRSRESLVQLYCSQCAWHGWREGLEIAVLESDPFAQGCRKLLDGDLVGAHKLLFKFGDAGYKGDFATSLLIHAVCMTVRPSITRAAKIFGGCGGR